MADKKAHASYAAWQLEAEHTKTVKLDVSDLISGVLALHVTQYHKQLIDHSKYQATTEDK